MKVLEPDEAASAPKLGAAAVEAPNENAGLVRAPKEGAVVGAAGFIAGATVCVL